jgi:cardiolipin synthase
VGADVVVPARPGDDRILTIPNAITLVRLACAPLFVWLLLGPQDRRAAAFLLAGVGATDWVDGYVARHFDQGSTLGKVLDPVADRVVFLVGVLAILVDGSAPAWFGVATLAREVLISIGTLVVAGLGARRIDVTWVGKAGTFALYFAYPWFLASHAHLGAPAVWRALAWTTGIPGLVLAWVALGRYVPMAMAAVRERRSGEGTTA